MISPGYNFSLSFFFLFIENVPVSIARWVNQDGAHFYTRTLFLFLIKLVHSDFPFDSTPLFLNTGYTNSYRFASNIIHDKSVLHLFRHSYGNVIPELVRCLAREQGMTLKTTIVSSSRRSRSDECETKLNPRGEPESREIARNLLASRATKDTYSLLRAEYGNKFTEIE